MVANTKWPIKRFSRQTAINHKTTLVQSIVSMYTFFYIQSNFDWICWDRTEGVCVSVRACDCLCVCVCVSSLQPIRMGRFWWNFPQMILKIFASDIFHGFWKFKTDDVMAAILYVFHSGTLTVAILLWFSSKLSTRYKVVFQCLLLKISKIGR